MIIGDFKTTCPSDKTVKKGNDGKSNREQALVAATLSSEPIDWEPIFPNLKTMHLEETTFPHDWEIPDLVAAFHARKMAGKGLKLLEIVECRNVDEEVLDALKRCVELVTWDEWTGTESSSDSSEDE